MHPIINIFGLLLVASFDAKLTNELQQQLANAKPGQMISCIVIMAETYPFDAMVDASIHEKILTCRTIAQQSQVPALAWLGMVPNDVIIHQRYWVINGFHVEAKPEIIMDLAQRDDVAWISNNGEVHIIAEPDYYSPPSARVIEWNIQKIMADSCWTAGYTGTGIILGETDTGVDYTHPALQGKWAGYWHDAINGQPTPYDDHNHGTHCMGTIMGGDGFGPFTEDIGVAPGATFAAAKVLNSGGSGTYAQCLEGLQFMADLKDSVDIKAVSNSWAGSSGPDTFFYPVTRTYKSIGILPIFANGNSGPGAGTVQVPGNYSTTLGVGATDINDNIADFSSRGPAPNQPPFNDPSTWFRDDWNLIKPQISAPGVNIRSCLPGGSYAPWNGTSMATPHVAGAVGIICQKNPNLSTTDLYNILLDNVDEPTGGAPYPNNNYGWGRLNVWNALNGTPTVDQPWLSLLSKTLTDPPPGGNNNGLMEPGETGKMVVMIKNVGGADAMNTVGTMTSFDNFVTINNATYNFGTLPPQGTANNNGNPFELIIHGLTPLGHIAKVGLILHADGQHDTLDFNDTLYHTFQIGTPPPPYVIYEDDYEYGSGIDSFLNYWEVTGNWVRSTTSSHSPTHSAYSGAASDSATSLTLKNVINLSAFADPHLGLWHRYRFEQGLFMDSAAILVSTNGGANWTAIWVYNWLTGDTLPWTEASLSLPASDNVKIRFLVDGYTFFQDYTDWFIDDFKIYTPPDNEPPYFANTTVWHDTGFTGPYPVQSRVTDASGVDSVSLYYRINVGSWVRLNMTPQGANIYLATIPGQPLFSVIDYYLWAKDRWIAPNTGCDPVGAPADGYYSFNVTTVVVEDARAVLPGQISFRRLHANPAPGPITCAFSIPATMRVSLTVYDITGRHVKTVRDALTSAGIYRATWNSKDANNRMVPAGIYFLKFKAGNFEQIEKSILLR